MKKLLGYKWKTPQTRKENVNNVLDIIGLGPNQDRMYCSLSTEVKGVCVVFRVNTPAHDLLRNAGALDELFIPVFNQGIKNIKQKSYIECMKKKKVMENKNDITKLKELLTEASEICLQNINEAENIDLHSMMETLDDFIDELNAIENFEIYDEE